MKNFICAIVACGAFNLACDIKGHESQSEMINNPPYDTSGDPIEIIDLPAPSLSGTVSLEQCLVERRSVRSFTDQALSLEEISQLFWAAQGRTHDAKKRTSPSAGALYPMEVYLVTEDRFYQYRPGGHRAAVLKEENLIGPLASASFSSFVSEAPAIFVLTVVYERLEEKYGERSERYAKLEAGHVSQNILLQAVSLGLGATPVGAFGDVAVQVVLEIPSNHEPLLLIPIGKPAE
jgi:SagB-type dehydrogenase family enzyme